MYHRLQTYQLGNKLRMHHCKGESSPIPNLRPSRILMRKVHRLYMHRASTDSNRYSKCRNMNKINTHLLAKRRRQHHMDSLLRITIRKVNHSSRAYTGIMRNNSQCTRMCQTRDSLLRHISTPKTSRVKPNLTNSNP